MDPIDKSTLQRIYATLPEEIRELLAAPETYATIDAIAAKYSVDGVERGLLAQATSRILLGTLKPNEYVATIVRYLDIEQSQAALIAQEINRDIFNPVKERLKELHGTENKSPEIPTKEGVASATPVRPAFTVPKPTPPIEAKSPNNLESRLGGVFAIRKEPFITAATVAPATVAPAAAPATPPLPSVPPQMVPATPPQTRIAPSIATPSEKLGLAPAEKTPSVTAPAVSLPSAANAADPYREAV